MTSSTTTTTVAGRSVERAPMRRRRLVASLLLSAAVTAWAQEPAAHSSQAAASQGSGVAVRVTGRVVRSDGSVPRPGSGQVSILAARSRADRLLEALAELQRLAADEGRQSGPAAPGNIAGELVLARGAWDRDGHFELVADLNGPARVLVQSAGHLDYEYAVLPVPSELHLPTLVLAPAHVERLRVVPPDVSSVGPADAAERSWVVLTQSERTGSVAPVGWRRPPLYGWTGGDRFSTPSGDDLAPDEFEFVRADAEMLQFYASNRWGRERIEIGDRGRNGGVTVAHDPLAEVSGRTLLVGLVTEPTVVLVDGRPVARLDADPGGGVHELRLNAGASSRIEALSRRASARIEIAIGGGGDEAVELSLRPWPRVRGTVRDAADGRPLAAAFVVAGATATRSGPDGGFEIATDPRRDVLVGASGYAWTRASRDAPPGDVELQRAASLIGELVDEAGGPVPGVELALSAVAEEDGAATSAPSLARLAALSDRRGQFRFLGLAPASRWRLEASPGEGRVVTPVQVAAAAVGEPAAPVRLVVRQPRAVLGWVVDAGEVPVRGAEVVLLDATPAGERIAGAPPRQQARTDGAGGFVLADVPFSRLHLLVRAPGHAPATISDLDLAGASRDRQGRYELGTVVLGDALDLEVELVDRDGAPVEGATVLFRGAHPRWSGEEVSGVDSPRVAPGDLRALPRRSDVDGRVRIAGLGSDEKVTLRIEHFDFVTRTVDAVELPRAEPVRVELERAAIVSGRALDARGREVSGAHVALRSRHPTIALPPRLYTRSGADGRFVLRGVPSGELVLWGRPPSGPDFDEIPLEVASGEEYNDLVLRSPDTATVTGVVRRGGRALEGVSVRCCGEAAVTDDFGEFTLAGVGIGAHTVHAVDDRGWVREVAIDLRPSEVRRIEVEFEEGLELSGRVVDMRGAPVSDSEVVLSRVGVGERTGSRPRARTPADGSFGFRGLEPGRYLLWAGGTAGEGRRRQGTRREIELGSDLRGVEVVLGGTGLITGRVLGLDARELQSVRLAARHEWTVTTAEVSADGAFRLDELAAGAWRLRASLPDGREVERQIELAEAGDRHVELEFAERALRLQLTARVDGAPLAAWVAADGPEGQVSWANLNAMGRGALEGLAPGTWHLAVADATSELVPVWSGVVAEDRTLELDLERVQISGRVVDATSRRPLPGAQLSLVGADADWIEKRSREQSADDGSFTLRALVPGVYRVLAVAPGYSPVELAMAGSAVGVEIALDRGGAAEAR